MSPVRNTVHNIHTIFSLAYIDIRAGAHTQVWAGIVNPNPTNETIPIHPSKSTLTLFLVGLTPPHHTWGFTIRYD